MKTFGLRTVLRDIAELYDISCGLLQLLKFIYKKITIPRLKFDLRDCPSSKESHYFLRICPWLSNKDEQKIRITLQPKRFGLKDYSIMLFPYEMRIGCDYPLKSIDFITDDTSYVSNIYLLKVAYRYRVIVTSNGGSIGSLPYESYDLSIELIDKE